MIRNKRYDYFTKLIITILRLILALYFFIIYTKIISA